MKNAPIKIICFIIIVPILILFLYSIFINYNYDDILPKVVSFKNYRTIFNITYLKLLFSSILMSLIVAVLSVAISYLFVRAIVVYNLNNLKIFRLFSMIPLLVPAYSYIMGLSMALNIFNLNNTYVGVIISHIIVTLPYNIFSIFNSYQIIGTDYEMLAKSYNASEKDLILDISLPMIKKTIFTTIAISFVISFSQYFLTLVVGGGMVKTYATYVFPLIQGNNRSLTASFSFIFCLINILIYTILINLNNKKSDVL